MSWREQDRSAEDRWQVSPRNPDGTRRAPARRRPRLTPTRVTLAVALIGSVAFLLYAITVRDASQIPLLSAGAAVLGLVFAALAVAGVISTYRAARDAHGGRAFMLALLGGGAALIAFGCFSWAVILAMVWKA